MSTSELDSETEEQIEEEYDERTQKERLGDAILDFGEDLEEYCVEKDLLIAESLTYKDIEQFLLSILDNSD
jgi:hypothetical protein